MKKIILSFAFIVCTLTIYSQIGNVGIGTTMPDSTASLHLGAPDKGFLPNQVALISLIDITPISKDGINIALPEEMPDGLMVYNTVTAGTSPNNVVPGYYIWDGSNNKWKSITAASSTYTHWGRNDCPGSTVIYTGYVAGSRYNDTGGGSNTLCLTDAPVYNNPVTGFFNSALLSGTEYEVALAPIGEHGGTQTDAVCAVCEVSAANILMIPGTNICPMGWTAQYSGFLMSTHYTHSRSEYVCVDETPFGGTADIINNNHNLWYKTEILTGSLPASIYTETFEVTCVVCSK